MWAMPRKVLRNQDVARLELRLRAVGALELRGSLQVHDVLPTRGDVVVGEVGGFPPVYVDVAGAHAVHDTLHLLDGDFPQSGTRRHHRRKLGQSS